MKKLDNELQQKGSDEQKRSYETPRLDTIKLFADQVLGSCPQAMTCGDFPKNLSLG